MDTVITSAQNATVKQLRRLATSAKARREANEYVAEGTHLAKSFLVSGRTPLRYVCAVSALRNSEVVELTTELAKKGAEQIVLADDLFESIFTIHALVGIALLFSIESPDITEFSATTVLLEDIQDPGNLGTLLRTAAATGVKYAALSPGCTSPWSPKALRAGMGAQFGMQVCESLDLAQLVTTATIPTLVTTLSSKSQSLYEIDLRQPVMWIFGNEGAGVSPSLTQAATTHVSIPQAETPVESLNVAAAAAVCLYEQYRQNLS